MAAEVLGPTMGVRALRAVPGSALGATVLLGAILLVVYRGVLPAWAADLWIDPNYSHGLLVPLGAIWLAYERRADLLALTPRPASSGILIVLAALGLLLLGQLASELFTTRLSLLVLIPGLLSFILGYRYVRVLAWPLGFLLFMVPLPSLVFNAIALPLQFIASKLAVNVLQTVGIPALREGNVILLANGTLEVAEACSGLRSLISLGAVAVLLAAVGLRRIPTRLVLIASAVPIAVITNGARVSGTGILAHAFGAGAAEGVFHTFSGWLVFVSALLLLGSEAAALRRVEGQ